MASQEDEMKRSGELLIRNIEVAINKSRALLARNPQDAAGIFYLAGSLGFSGRHALMENNLPRAITTGWEAFQLLQKNTGTFQDDVDVLLGHGIFNFYAGRLPASMRGFAKLLGVQGDWKLGIEQLKRVVSDGVFANTEAEVTLSYIYTYDLRDGINGARYSKSLMERYPRNPEFRYQYAENLISSGQYGDSRGGPCPCRRQDVYKDPAVPALLHPGQGSRRREKQRRHRALAYPCHCQPDQNHGELSRVGARPARRCLPCPWEQARGGGGFQARA